jgi:hypothetical protein
MLPDDPSITDETLLYRRVTAEHYRRAAEGWTFTSGLFDNSSDGEQEMSVVIASKLEADGRTIEDLALPDIGWIAITAGVARNEGQAVAHAPEPDEPAHGAVCGAKGSKKRKRMKEAAEWVIYPTDAE